MNARTSRALPLSEKVIRAKSIVDDRTYQARRRRPVVPRFLPTRDGGYEYDPAATYLCAVASAWAYSDAETLRAELKDAMEVDLQCHAFSASNPTMYLDTDAFFVVTDDPMLDSRIGILVFRGTEFTRVGDLLADANVEMLPFPYGGNEKGKVHGGFFQGAMAVWKRVYNMLVSEPVDHLVITGHSLGAAMAVMTTAQLYREHELAQDPRFERVVASLRGLYTFGQPAVGDANFARWSQETFGPLTFRHVYAHDVIPHVPTTDINALYQHFKCGVWTCKRNQERWSGPNADLTFNVARSFGAAMGLAMADFFTRRIPFRMKLTKALFDSALPYSFDDHSPMHYIRVSEASYRTAPQALSARPAGAELESGSRITASAQ